MLECFQFNLSADIEFDYRFRHKHQLDVDSLKVVRVFCNIIANAAQAMKGYGRIWFDTDEIDDAITITIGNSKSYIPLEDREKLFEAFYTQKKKGGTGLGLAIARKIVVDHGGKIACHSDREYGTEFVFTLPIAFGFQSTTEVQLPDSTAKVRIICALLGQTPGPETEGQDEESTPCILGATNHDQIKNQDNYSCSR